MNRDARAPALIAWMVAVLLAPIPSLALAQDVQPEHDAILPLDEISPGYLGMYKKLMLIEDEIRRFSEQYGVDFDLARAVCLYESGGNRGLTSVAGAQGYFQVMPATFRSLRVKTNIEAGVKYLAQLVNRFDREDYAVAAYNTGPTRVARRRPMPLETLQYVFGVGHFRAVLKQHGRSVRFHVEQLDLATVEAGEGWYGIARRVGVPTVELRMHNPFLAGRRLRADALVAYPKVPRGNLVVVDGDAMEYRVRYGDNYFHLAFSLGVGLDTLRASNNLWRLQSVLPGLTLRMPLTEGTKFRDHLVQPGQTLGSIADGLEADAWLIIRDNGLFATDEVAPGTVLKIRTANAGRQPASRAARASTVSAAGIVTYRVVRGDTLSALADRYGTSVSAIQAASGTGRRTTLRIGQTLRIPTSSAGGGAEAITHRVERGDTLSDLARQYGTTVSAIQNASGIGRRTMLRIGQELQIQASSSTDSTQEASDTFVTHRVERGDTLSDLATRYGTTVAAIQNANGTGRGTMLRIGQLLRIPVTSAAGTASGTP